MNYKQNKLNKNKKKSNKLKLICIQVIFIKLVLWKITNKKKLKIIKMKSKNKCNFSKKKIYNNKVIS